MAPFFIAAALPPECSFTGASPFLQQVRYEALGHWPRVDEHDATHRNLRTLRAGQLSKIR